MGADVTIRYGRLELDGGPDVSVTWPVDVLLRYSRMEDPSLAALDLSTLRGRGLLGRSDELASEIARSFTERLRLLRRWKTSDAVSDVEKAARAAVGGQISPRIAAHLGRVIFTSEQTAHVPDFLALVALGIHHVALSVGRYEIRNCAHCMKPFLATERATYCRRFAPDSNLQTCMDVAKVRDFRARKRQERGRP